MNSAPRVFITASPEETAKLGVALGKLVPPGLTLALKGDLGAGKTVLVRGLAEGFLGPGAAAVTSPTYVLLHEYKSGHRTLYHIDAYRLRSAAEEFEGSGLMECLADKEGLTCIEWPERIGGALPAECLEVHLEHIEEGRRITISGTGAAIRVLEGLASVRLI